MGKRWKIKTRTKTAHSTHWRTNKHFVDIFIISPNHFHIECALPERNKFNRYTDCRVRIKKAIRIRKQHTRRLASCVYHSLSDIMQIGVWHLSSTGRSFSHWPLCRCSGTSRKEFPPLPFADVTQRHMRMKKKTEKMQTRHKRLLDAIQLYGYVSGVAAAANRSSMSSIRPIQTTN